MIIEITTFLIKMSKEYLCLSEAVVSKPYL